MLNVSVLLGGGVAVGANTATPIGADWLSADKCPLVVNEDNDHFFKLPASWMTREGLVRYLDDVLQGSVTHFVMCVNGQRTSYDSKTWEPIWKGVDESARTDTATAMDGTHDSWGLGVRVKVHEDWLPVGAFGWSGAYGTHFWVDPANRIVALLMRNMRWHDTHGAGAMGVEFERLVMRCA